MIWMLLHILAVITGFGLSVLWGIWAAVNGVNAWVFLLVTIFIAIGNGIMTAIMTQEVMRYFSRRNK